MGTDRVPLPKHETDTLVILGVLLPHPGTRVATTEDLSVAIVVRSVNCQAQHLRVPSQLLLPHPRLHGRYLVLVVDLRVITQPELCAGERRVRLKRILHKMRWRQAQLSVGQDVLERGLPRRVMEVEVARDAERAGVGAHETRMLVAAARAADQLFGRSRH